MIHDQADELRQLVRQRALADHRPRAASALVVVAAGKGGVGTTTIAANLAIALARRGNRAVFVDADLDHSGNAQLGQNPHRGSILDVLAGRRTVHEVLQRGPGGIQVLGGSWASGARVEYSAAAQDRFVGELEQLAPHAEVVVVDAGSGRGPLARRFWLAAGSVLAVTTTDSVSVMECYAAMKVLAADGGAPVHTLVNFASDALAAGDVHARISQACRRFLGFSTAAAGQVALCERSSAGDQLLVFPTRSEPARALDRVSDKLWAELQLVLARGSAQRRTTAA